VAIPQYDRLSQQQLHCLLLLATTVRLYRYLLDHLLACMHYCNSQSSISKGKSWEVNLLKAGLKISHLQLWQLKAMVLN